MLLRPASLVPRRAAPRVLAVIRFDIFSLPRVEATMLPPGVSGRVQLWREQRRSIAHRVPFARKETSWRMGIHELHLCADLVPDIFCFVFNFGFFALPHARRHLTKKASRSPCGLSWSHVTTVGQVQQ